MRFLVCAVRDRAADAFGRPLFVATVGTAIRSFSDEVNRADKDNSMYMHPEDYDLYELGHWDDDTGAFSADDKKPRQIAIGKDCVTTKQ